MHPLLENTGMTDPVRGVIERWLSEPRFASERPALEGLLAAAAGGDAAARNELDDAFADTLPIGTGGRRGRCGPGPNRINRVVLRETALGLASAMKRRSLPPKVAVVYDTRRDSARFARVVAAQLAASGLGVLLVTAPRPTPQLSFLVRAAECGAGIVISASHNPPADNGIKIYGPDGAQVLASFADEVVAEIGAASDAALPDLEDDHPNVQSLDPVEHPNWGDAAYHAYVTAQGVLTEPAAMQGLTVAFTPLHGVGHTSVVPVLRSRGAAVQAVAAQCDPDGGNFSTVVSANPEDPRSMQMALELGQSADADLVLATDPDADRLGACARDRHGDLVPIDGNRLGVLMLDHVLRQDPSAAQGLVLSTQVTSPLIGALARAHGCEVVDDLLVGFKNHASMLAERPDRSLVFACEESHGYLRGTEVRDKDAAIAALLLSECAAEAKRAGLTLFDRLAQIWSRHGYHVERTANLVAVGPAGRRAIAAVMERFRRSTPAEIAGLRVREVEDRLVPRATGSATRDLPANVLALELEAGDVAVRLALRPSGTEPKLKVYVLARAEPSASADATRSAQVDEVLERVITAAESMARETMDGVMADGSRE
ncbi:MAG: phospho-sugar mutase [Myxococcales bacterium FL481]|nr:MAG: phospho-sugar mutase [Myxococcales bacterium FL481]